MWRGWWCCSITSILVTIWSVHLVDGSTTTPVPTLTTTVIDTQKAFHCSDKPKSNCGSRVSRCQLLKACNCTLTPADLITRQCECCDRCISCLGPYLMECCACVGLCELTPMSEEIEEEGAEFELYHEYEVETFQVVKEHLNLFEEEFAPTPNRGFQMYVYSPHEEMGALGSRLHKDVAQSIATSYRPVDNCTIIYFDECLSKKTCTDNCKLLKASSLRWFRTGCCECAGQHCLAGGSTTSRCDNCREEDFPEIDFEEEEELELDEERDVKDDL